MNALRLVTAVVAVVLAAGEVARWWSSPRFVPLAFDELLVAAAMLAAATLARRRGAAPLAAAWGLFCGLVLGLLVPTLDHLLGGPEKESAVFYAAVLAALLGLGLVAMGVSLRLARPRTEH